MDLTPIATRFNDAYNARDPDALRALYAEDVRGVWHVGPAPVRYTTRDDVVGHWEREWAGWPNATYMARRIVVGDGIVATQNLWSATNTGVIVTPDDMEVPPTGGHVELECATFMTFEGAKVATFENYWDNMLTFIQLGLMPDPTSIG